ncbi:MAG: NAD(P)-dependent oxidoreductase [Paracoccaceae bacterium]
MKLILFGAAGDVGRRILDEALSRGHEVTAVLRRPEQAATLPHGAVVAIADAGRPGAAAALIPGNDLAISALRPPAGQEEQLVPLTRAVLEGAAQAGIRALIVGGAATLKLADDGGHTVLSAPGFLPPAVVPIAEACAAQHDMIRTEARGDWAYLCPPAMLQPGARTGRYRSGGDTLVTGPDGQSRISMEDFAVALLDEAETPRNTGARFTVGW